MTQITLKKRSSSQLFSHLYEHIVFIYLYSTLRSADMAPIIDFDIDAYTEDAAVVIDLNAYTSHIEIASILDSLNKMAVDSILETAVMQLEVEHGQKLDIKDASALLELLRQFHKTEWSTGECLFVPSGLIDFGPVVKPRLYTITASYPQVNQEETAFFRLIAGTCLNTICSDLVDDHAGFIDSELFFENTDGDLEMKLLIHPSIDARAVRSFIRDNQGEILRSAAYGRLLESLQDVDSMELPPSNDVRRDGVSIIMDAQSWRRVATRKTFRRLSTAITLNIQ